VRAVTGIDARLERGTEPGLHPGKTARVFAGDAAVGFIGTVDPRLLRAADIGDDVVAVVIAVDELPAHRVRPYRPVSKYPPIERDLAIVVDPSVTAAEVVATIRSDTPLARSVEVFDEYRGAQIGASKKSLAVRVVLQRDDATLTDAEADAALQQVLGGLRGAHGATLRG
jgi:phenylalanyl-tRNA synthetase beta chain